MYSDYESEEVSDYDLYLDYYSELKELHKASKRGTTEEIGKLAIFRICQLGELEETAEETLNTLIREQKTKYSDDDLECFQIMKRKVIEWNKFFTEQMKAFETN